MKQQFLNFKKNKNSIIITVVLIILVSISNTSCSKPEDGTNGIDGAAGTTNVIYSNWISPSFTSYATSEVAEISEPKINQNILDSGTILVFYKLGNEVYSLNYYNLAASYSIVSVFSLGQIRIVRSIPSNGGQFRYIIIPGGLPIARSSALIDTKKMTYSQICTFLNIPE